MKINHKNKNINNKKVIFNIYNKFIRQYHSTYMNTCREKHEGKIANINLYLAPALAIIMSQASCNKGIIYIILI